MIDKKTNRKTKAPPKFLRQGDSAIVRLEVSSGQQICLETYKDLQQLGRFTLRDEGAFETLFSNLADLSPEKMCRAGANSSSIGKTIAIGKVTKLIVNEGQ